MEVVRSLFSGFGFGLVSISLNNEKTERNNKNIMHINHVIHFPYKKYLFARYNMETERFFVFSCVF